MLLLFDVGIIYLLDVNTCAHVVNGGIHSIFLEILLWSATEQVTENYLHKIYYYYYYCPLLSFFLIYIL